MVNDYTTEYELLLKQTLRGARTRAFFLGYGSETLDNYLHEQKGKIWDIESNAFDEGQKIHTTKNCRLGSDLFGLEVKVMMNKLNFA